MRKLLFTLVFMSVLGYNFARQTQTASEVRPALSFTENRGQVLDTDGKPRADVLFTAENNGVKLYFRSDAVSYVFSQNEKEGENTVIKSWYRADIRFAGANPNVRVTSEQALPYAFNYYHASNSKGVLGVRSYEKITYHNIYPNIDLVFFTTQDKSASIKYEFVVRPGGNPDQIKLQYQGFNGLAVNRDGSIEARTTMGTIGEAAPYTYQGSKTVSSAFAVKNGEVSFQIGDYDKSQTLVIDPLTRQFSFNRGGTTFDRAMGTDMDANGNSIIVGWTASTNFPVTVGALQNVNRGDNDAVVLQVSPTGTILWATYFGGTGRDQALAVAVGTNNAINIGGTTTSANLPVTSGALQTSAGLGGDGFLMQLTSAGALNWATYFGGAANDQISAVDVFTNGDVAITGRTFSPNNIATVGSLAGTRDAFVGRIKADGTSRVWSRYIGGADDEQGWAVVTDANDNVYVGGQTGSLNLATSGVMQTVRQSTTDAFISKYSSSGTPVWFSYYGGNDLDFITALDIDDAGNVFGTGVTSSSLNFPLSNNVFQPAFGGLQDAFLFAANPNGGLVMSTYLGGAGTEQGYGIGLVGNHVYVTGSSNSQNWSPVNPNAVNLPFQANNAGSFDFFLTKVNTTNFTRSWSILNGGVGDDVSRALATNGQGKISVVGYTNSNNFSNFPSPIQGQNTAGTGNDDLFIFHVSDDVAGCPTVNVTATASNAICDALPTGSVNVTAPLGNNFVYSLSGQSTRPAQSGTTFLDLPSGNYTLKVKNTTDNCEYTRPITLKADVPFTVTTSKTNPACGIGGSINVTSPTGNDLTYSLTGPVNVVNSPSPVFSNLISGSYVVTVQDGLGCQVMTSAIVLSDANTLASPSVSTKNATCATATDGAITVTAPLGGTLTYTLTGTVNRPAQSSPVFANLPVGSYSVIAQSGNCTSTATNASILAGNGLTVTSNTLGTTCSISSDGSIIVTSFVGAIYSLEGTESRPAQTLNRFDNLKSGSYIVNVVDAQGCTGIVNVFVPVSTTQTPVVVSTVPTTCINNNNGILTIISPTPAGSRYSLFGSNVNIENSATNVFGNLPSGSYVASVLLPNGCTLTSNPTFISNPSQLVASATGGVIACGSSNGAINVTATGGSGTLQYELSGPVNRPKQTSNVFSGLIAGNYNVIVSDANGCATTTNATINLPGALSLQTTATSTVCGQDNGTITVTSATGGTGTILYSIIAGPVLRDPQTSATFTNLAAGDYTVKIADANNCSATAPVKVTAGPNALILDPVIDPILCKGGTATITVGVTGNTGSMTYTLSSRAPQPGNNRFINVTPGVYLLTVVDSRNCTASQTINITEPTQLAATATVTQISCPNQQLGQVIVSATGGTGVKMFTLTGPVTIGPQPSNTFTNLNPGTYRASVMDANGCMVDVASSLTINNINRVQIGSLVPTMPKCNAGSDGSITVNLAPSTGTAPFAYRINNGAYSPTTSATTYSFGNLKAGSYTVDVRDVNGCIATSTTNLSEPTVITGVVSGIVPTSCVVGDGSLTVSATGGTPPYQYSLDGANYQPSNRFDFVQAGFYTVTIRDNNGCTGTTTYTLNHSGSPKILNVSVTGTECFTNNGASTGQIVIAAAGAPNLFYSINDGVSFTASSSGSIVFDNLSAGVYLIRVSDINGCTAFWKPVTVEAPDPFIIQNVIVTNPVCSNINPVGGTIEVQAIGGKLPLRFSVDGGITFSLSNRITDLYPRIGGYQIVVVDANGCTALGGGTRNMFNASGLILDPANVRSTQPTCGKTNGSITVTPSGGSPGTKKYFINGILDGTTSNTSYTYRNLAEGDYTIRVVDAAGCRVESRVSLSTLNVTLTPTAGACNGAFGQIVVDVNGGTGNYQYTITGSAFQLPLFAVIPINFTVSPGQGVVSVPFTNLYPGLYEIEVLDLGSPAACTRKVKIALGTTGAAPTITNVTKIDRVCSGSTQVSTTMIGSISTFVSGAATVHIMGPINVIGQAPVNNSTTFMQAGGLPAGEYYVFADNGNGCFSAYAMPVTITEPAPIVIAGVSIMQPRCKGIATGSFMVNATGGSILEYSMNGGVNFQASPTFSNLAPGTSIIANNIVVREQGTLLNCWTSWPLQVDINNEGNFFMSANATNQTCSGLPDGSITINVSGGQGPFTYTLTPEVGPVMTFSNILAGSQQFTGLVAGNYTARAVDANGCIAVLNGPITILASSTTLSLTATQSYDCVGQMGAFDLTINSTSAGPFDVSVDGGVTTLLSNQVANVVIPVTNLIAGNFNVVVTDRSNNCKISGAVTILGTVPAPRLVSLNVSNAQCPGENSGSVQATVQFTSASGGTAQLIGANGIRTRNSAGTSVFNPWRNLAPGNYTLVITGNDCTAPYQQNITITGPTPVNFTTDVTRASCGGVNGVPDGRIVVNASGGVGPYLYSLDAGNTFNVSNIFNGLTPGNYDVVVKDAGISNSCLPTAVKSVAVTSTSNFYINPSDFTINGAIQASCNDVNNAYIEIIVENPPTNPVYYLNGQVVTPQDVTPNFIPQKIMRFNNVISRNNVVRVVDALGCFDELAVTIAPTLPLTVATPVIRTTPSCGASNDGIVEVTVTGGTDAGTPNPPLTGRQYTFADYFAVVTPPANTVPQSGIFQILGVTHGVYELSVFNARDPQCRTNRYVAVNSVGAPGIQACATNVIQPIAPNCNTGQVRLTMAGSCTSNPSGVAAFQRRQIGQAGWTTNPLGATNSTFRNLTPGTYVFRARYGANCFAYTPPVTLTANGTCVSPKELAFETLTDQELSVYPNPTRGEFQLKFTSNESENVSVKLVDMTGREVMNQSVISQEGINDIPFNMSGLTDGVYILTVNRNGQLTTLKVVKN